MGEFKRSDDQMRMNISDQQFNLKLEEISQAYEDAKDGITGLIYPIDFETANKDAEKAMENIRKLRDLAATALQAQFMIKEN